MDSRSIATVILLASAWLAAPSISLARPEVPTPVHGMGCVRSVCIFAIRPVITPDSKIANDSLLAIDKSSWSKATPAVGSNLARIRRGQFVRRK